MKAVLLLAFILFWTANSLAQGLLNWGNNLTGFRAAIYNLDPGNPSAAFSGQSSNDIPAGTTVYNGPLLGAGGNGLNYTFGIYGGPLSASSNTLTLIATTTFRTSAGNNLPAGLV